MATQLVAPQTSKLEAQAPFMGRTAQPRLRDTAVVIPTHNAARYWPGLTAALQQQGLRPDQILIIDSSSTDGTAALVKDAGFQIVTIPGAEFHHGRTRQMALGCVPWAKFLVYLTQDAILASATALQDLLKPFDDPAVGAVGGRQLPRPDADLIEQHARLYNYPDRTSVRTFESRHELGFKAAFLSNSFAAYRRAAMEDVGGFPSDVILAEDAVIAARMLKAGWAVVHQGEASVIHSHPLTVWAEFCRYFDTGVMHQQQAWLLADFGGPGGEGGRFVRSEFRFLTKRAPLLLPKAALRTGLKLIAYKLGRWQQHLPLWLKRRMTAHPNYWR